MEFPDQGKHRIYHLIISISIKYFFPYCANCTYNPYMYIYEDVFQLNKDSARTNFARFYAIVKAGLTSVTFISLVPSANEKDEKQRELPKSKC